ncbi:hypothetical protein L7F22_005738 [Adiantum nelumboides]|nr:hypothetical protein [Adiantum nelumboides]
MEEGGITLLEQLDHILSSDRHIDELGYVHPSQLAGLHEGSVHVDDSVADPSVFWCGEHKLAISIQALVPLYNAAKSAFIASHQVLLGTSKDGFHESGGTEDFHFLAEELLSLTRSVVVLNPGFKTAWDVRKQIFVTLSNVGPLEELQLSSLVLSFNPKCEEAWAHRRWTICSRIESIFPYQITENLLQQELKLVAMIADRSRMNFQAWRHCCWLVQWMSPVQMLDELQTWKRWAELHVAENSCFHFRRCLFEKLLTDEDNSLRMKDVWLEELEWNKKLIKLYIGREALWLHQRFLFFLWVHHFKRTDSAGSIEHPFPLAEISFANSCIDSCNDDEDNQKQIACASTFKLWVLLKCKESSTVLDDSKAQMTELLSIEQLLGSNAAHQKALWEGLLKIFKVQRGNFSGF